eukprot:CAMPEP_0174371730 /NCGR_PEP_ID=MMETSP0811_2-20130205/100864_1 /TAXON_ID=73025 ORGANISM="Eutreptiella gymnastica-like, Strain CCMP1594" /NCGR_SAMPLE_ID=MMETSP0811_2 /ASSEMBLY_ACC=CAM_ASM_000667 /LENGTH=40 /DNA_ID= /DNA_START= /DNA_END= /DNA_ORIENTATION=
MTTCAYAREMVAHALLWKSKSRDIRSKVCRFRMDESLEEL